MRKKLKWTNLIMFSYSLSRPFESLHRLYMTEASTLAGLKVFGSLSSDITLSKIVRTFWVGFQRSQGNSPDWGSSTGGWSILIHKSPFWKRNYQNCFRFVTRIWWMDTSNCLSSIDNTFIHLKLELYTMSEYVRNILLLILVYSMLKYSKKNSYKYLS